jgi:stage II sporulation protein D
MSQWGAYGYAKHGWGWQRILAHYYPGTQLSRAPVSRVRVLLTTAQPRVRVGCATPLKVSDASGRWHTLPPRNYVLTKKLKLRRLTLESPLVFDCPAAPLTLNGRGYHGLLIVRKAKKLTVINSLSLDDYVRGVVAGEMPHRWSIAALRAQAVAARSYALATSHPNKHFDLFSDTRSQVYGGTAYETPRTNRAVSDTAGKVLTWKGRVATTFFFSTSGGRTADDKDVWPNLGDVPYLQSVDDPYDAASPHHVWRVVLKLDRPFRAVASADGRARWVYLGDERIDANEFRRARGLQSTWFDVGKLSLATPTPRVRFGGTVQLRLDAEGLGAASLERRIGAGAWKRLATVTGARIVEVQPRAHTLYRLRVDGVNGPVIGVDVAPKVTVTPAGTALLSGTVQPSTRGTITVTRRVGDGWKVVGHPRLDRRGTFRAPVRLKPGHYRVEVADDGRYASARTDVRVTPRLLASLR